MPCSDDRLVISEYKTDIFQIFIKTKKEHRYYKCNKSIWFRNTNTNIISFGNVSEYKYYLSL